MTNLADIVRPFLPQSVAPSAGGPKREKSTTTNSSQLVIEASGVTTITINESSSTSWSGVWAQRQQKEISRVYDTVRIKNPDDETQHVDVEALRKQRIERVPNTDRTYDVSYPKVPEGSNVEVLQSNQTRQAT